VQDLAADERIADTTANIPHPYPEGEAERWLASVAERTEAGTLRAFAITTSDADVLKGVISLMDLDEASAEVGFWVGVPHWGQGLAGGALGQLCTLAKDELGLESLRARVLARNPASARVLERNGFACIERATARCGYRQQAEPTDLFLRTL
jgi:RimJ/RimL family protein N-acetyltransferase